MKKALITQSNYIPWKGYFDAIHETDVFVLYDDMQYTKRDWRNRNKIKTQNGLQWLTIPVEVSGKFFQKINETKISDAGWAKSHWNSIRHNYADAPYFQQYKDFFEDLYMNSVDQNLSQINLRFLKAVCGLLDIKTEFRLSSEFELRGERSEKLLNICLDLGCTTYISGPAAKDYLDVSIFTANGITLQWLDYSDYPEYEQLHGGFEHGVSIVDLVFNTGPEIKKYMKSF